MDIKIENQIRELAKKIEGPLSELDGLMDEYYLLEEDLEFPESSSAHFETECEFEYLNSYKEGLEELISSSLAQITVLSNEDIYDDPIEYLKPYIEIPEEIQEIVCELV